MARRLGTWLAPLSLVVLVACGGSGGSPDVPFPPTDENPSDSPAGDPGPDAAKDPTVVDEPFRIVFPYLSYQPDPKIDLFWVDPARPVADPVASFDAALAEADPSLAEIGCSLGCIADASGRWLAVVAAGPSSTTSGSVVRLFRLRDGPTLQASGIPDVVDVRTFAFGADAFVFTRQQYGCYEAEAQPKACAKFFRIDLSVPSPAGEQALFTFPGPDDLDKVFPPSGAFRMGEDGRTILVLGPTAGSQSAWVWRIPATGAPSGTATRVLGPICAGVAPGGGCLESGSPFSDTDPVALSPDGNHLVMALVENNHALVLIHVDLQGTGKYSTTSLLAMPEGVGSYADSHCYNRKPWQPTFVQGPLRFSPDGTEVVFVGGLDCRTPSPKTWTNVLALSLDRIDGQGALARDDLRWITDFPQGDGAATVTILPDSVDLSPTGDHVVFAGTPRLDSDGNLIADNQDQHRNDSEVWVTRRDGTTLPVQLTRRFNWKATSARAIAVPSPAP